MVEARANRYARLREALRRVLSHEATEDSSSLGELLDRHRTVTGALTYAALFCPPLIEVDGRVYQMLVCWLPEDAMEAAESIRNRVHGEFGGDAGRFQALQNHVHIVELLEVEVVGESEEAVWQARPSSPSSWVTPGRAGSASPLRASHL